MSGFSRMERWRRRLLIGAGVLLALSTTAACTVSVVGGVAGAVVSVLAAVALIAGITTTETGCAQTCLSAVYDPDVPDADIDTNVGVCLSQRFEDIGPCLSRRLDDVGPCLGMPYEDVGPCLQPRWDACPDSGDAVDTYVGPCLSRQWDAGPDVESDVGPCLSRAWDVGPCLSDVTPDADAGVGPCLSAPPADASDGETTMAPALEVPLPPREVARAEARVRLAAAGALPPDLLTRLRDRPRA